MMKLITVLFVSLCSLNAFSGFPTEAQILSVTGDRVIPIKISAIDKNLMEFTPGGGGCTYAYRGKLNVFIGGEEYVKDDSFKGITIRAEPKGTGCDLDENSVEYLQIRLRHKTLKSEQRKLIFTYRNKRLEIRKPAGVSWGKKDDAYFNSWWAGSGTFTTTKSEGGK